MPRDARQSLANAITWLDPGLEGGAISKNEAAIALSAALKHEQRILPASLANSDFKASQDFQLHLLNLLSRYAGKEQIPLLTAMAEEKPSISVKQSVDGFTIEIPYPDKTSRFITSKNGEILAFGRREADGKELEKWTKDKTKGVYYASTDLKKEHPWSCSPRLEQDGTFVISDPPNPALDIPYQCYERNDRGAFAKAGAISSGGTLMNTYGTETTYLPSGGIIERSELGPHGLAVLWINITYPDGSSRARVIDSSGHASSKTVYRASEARKQSRNSDNGDPMFRRPDWLSTSPVDKARLTVDNNLIDYKTGAVLRKDRDKTDSSETIYTTTMRADGKVTCDRETKASTPNITDDRETKERALRSKLSEENSDKKAPTRILQTDALSPDSSQGMPLVREAARKILAQLSSTDGKAGAISTSQQNHDDYEQTKIEMRDRYLRSLMELGADWFSKQGKYDLLDGEKFGQAELGKAQATLRSSLWPWQRPFHSPDFETAGDHFHDEMKAQFENLVREAQQPDIPGTDGNEANSSRAQARAALAYIILSNGRPFRSEADRDEAIQLAAEGISDICQNKTAGTREMASIVSGALIADPTLSSKTRQTLFHALQEMVDKEGTNTPGLLASETVVPAMISALEAEYRSMPTEYLQNRVRRWANPAYAESEKLQIEMLDYLKNLDCQQYMPVLEALFENSSSLSIKYKAQELLRHFDRVGNIDFVSHPETDPKQKAAAIARILSNSKVSEDRVCETIISNCDTTFVEEGNRTADARAEILLQAMKSPNERVRTAAARGFTRCSSRSYIDIPDDVLLTVYEIAQNGTRTACKEEAASILAPITWKYKFDPSGDLWASKVKPRLDELLKAKQAQQGQKK